MFPRVLLILITVAQLTSAQCIRLPDGSWSCPTAPAAKPTAMDIRVECPTSRGSGTAVARLADGGTGIITNHHVVKGQSTVTLHAGDGQTAVGHVAVTDAANDLALVTIAERWPIVTLGDDVALGTPVQFRAFDQGLRFRKYYGRVVSEYTQAGAAAGYFASGASVEGNSGGGVYHQGKLVGVIWGNPAGQTALVRMGPVRQLLSRLPTRSPLQRSSRPALPHPHASPHPPCDCEERWAALDARLETFGDQQQPQQQIPSIDLPWDKLALGALGLSGPIGLGIAAAGALAGWLRKRSERGPGGPRDAPFPRHEDNRG